MTDTREAFEAWWKNHYGQILTVEGDDADADSAARIARITALEAWQAARAGTSAEPFQGRVQPWMLACFGAEIALDRVERNHRFFEEATETVQANGMTRSEAHQLVDYTYDRPVGELNQEVGGVMVTLAALCLASGVDMHAAGETELARIWTKVEQIRAKQAAKPKHSPLPAAPLTREAATVPPGFKLVPIEPDDAMADAACPAGATIDHFDIKTALRAAIAAAPASRTDESPVAKLRIGTSIRFTQTLREGATGDHPAFLYAEAGESGEITGYNEFEGYMVKTDAWPHAFGARHSEFEVAAPLPRTSDAALAEEAHVARRMSETLAEVYLTILGEDAPDSDGNALDKVLKAAQVLRMEVDLYRAQAAQPVADDTGTKESQS